MSTDPVPPEVTAAADDLIRAVDIESARLLDLQLHKVGDELTPTERGWILVGAKVGHAAVLNVLRDRGMLRGTR